MPTFKAKMNKILDSQGLFINPGFWGVCLGKVTSVHWSSEPQFLHGNNK